MLWHRNYRWQHNNNMPRVITLIFTSCIHNTPEMDQQPLFLSVANKFTGSSATYDFPTNNVQCILWVYMHHMSELSQPPWPDHNNYTTSPPQYCCWRYKQKCNKVQVTLSLITISHHTEFAQQNTSCCVITQQNTSCCVITQQNTSCCVIAHQNTSCCVITHQNTSCCVIAQHNTSCCVITQQRKKGKYSHNTTNIPFQRHWLYFQINQSIIGPLYETQSRYNDMSQYSTVLVSVCCVWTSLHYTCHVSCIRAWWCGN
jgi:hypothetical protein